MPVCCGSSGMPFVQTRFLGASIVRFSAQADWNGAGGGLQVELAEDTCSGDAFDPPKMGSPVYFSFGGFTYGGILQNWKQNDAADGAKSYTVNCNSAKDLMEGCNVILGNYSGPTFGVPNLANVFGWLEATYGETCEEVGFTSEIPGFSADLTYPPAPGFGGAANNEVGIPWNLVLTGLNTILNGGGGDYGSSISFNGHIYNVDVSELPLLSAEIRIGGENMTLDSLVAHVCSLGGVDYFYELITIGAECTGTTTNIIKIRTTSGTLDESAELVDDACGTQIDSRLSLGVIGETIANSTCVNRYGRGLELRMDTTNAFLTGEFRQDLWQTAFDDNSGDSGGTEYEGKGAATIWPYWGKNPDGSIIIGEEYSDGTFPAEKDELDYGHNFIVDTSTLGLGVATWNVTMYELHAALVSQGNWEAWLFEFEREKYDQLTGESEINLGAEDLVVALEDDPSPNAALLERDHAINNPDVADAVFGKAADIFNDAKEHVQNMGAPDDVQMAKNGKLYDFIRKYAQEYYGRKFMVKLPFLCKRFNPDTPWTLETNWETTDSGWTEWPVLGIPNNHWILDQFRVDDGKIQCFAKFTSDKPMILDNLSKGDFFAIDIYNVYVSGTAEEIVWPTPTDARAVVTLSGPIQQHNPYEVMPEWLLTFAMMGRIHGNDKDGIMNLLKCISNDKLALGMSEPFILPVACTVPMQSRRLVYGPWFAKKTDVPGYDYFGGGDLFGGSDKGRTEYQRESGFAPWHFGSFASMDWVAFSTASTMLGEQYVAEMGDITFPGAPTGSLGSLIASGGPSISAVDVQVGRGNGAVTTTYRMRTYTPDTSVLTKQRLDQIRHNATIAQKAERMFRKHALDRLRNLYSNKLSQQLQQWKTSVGLSGTSSHDFMGGQAGEDPNGPSLTTVPLEEIQHYHTKANATKTFHSPAQYEEALQDDEPHARTVATSSEARKDLRTLRADAGHRWRRRAYMENIGMFRPYSTLPHNQKAAQDDAYFLPHWRNETNNDVLMCGGGAGQAKMPPPPGGCPSGEKQYMTNNADFYSHEQVPPIFCKEQHLPINICTLSPFLSKGRALIPGSNGWSNGGICMSKSPDSSVGHDIEYIARDGVYPTNLSVRHPYDNYSQNHWYRAVALKGPLVLAGWGFDIDNKPVPNESTSYPNNPKMKFEQDWLRKPQKWMCGPVDLRWDYKRHVWTAPSPMKIVKLQLDETICPNSSANAILYDDQEQYDYDGSPLDCEEDCGATRQGYKVKVYSNAMYPVPGGWKIMACFDTTHNRYQMINHDPLPIVEVDIDADMMCVDGTGTIVGPAGSCELDPCDVLTDMPIDLKNTLNQPLCAPRKVYAWICGFECSGEGEEGPTLNSCTEKGSAPVRAKGIILQAEFKPECVVTHLELLEFYAWGYDVSCDEEDITIYPQGDVETCWDWCLNIDGKACVPSYSSFTLSGTHSHTCIFTGSVSGTVVGSTASDTHSHTGTFSGTIIGGEIEGIASYDSHNHTADYDGTLEGTVVGGTVSGEATGDISASGTGTITAASGTGPVTGTCDGDIPAVQVDITGIAAANGGGVYNGSAEGTLSGTTDNGTTCVITLSGTATANCDLTGIPEAAIEASLTDATCSITCDPVISCVGSGVYCTVGSMYCDCEIIGGKVTIPMDDILGAMDCDVTIDPITVSGNICNHTHDFSDSVNIPVSVTIPNHTHTVTGSGLVPAGELANGVISGTADTVVTGTTDVVVSGEFNGSIDGTFTGGTISGTTSGPVTVDGDSHGHSVTGDITAGTLSGTVDLNTDTHNHDVELSFSGPLSGVASCVSGEHNHEFTIPCQDAYLALDSDMDIDIDARFVPSPCTIRIAVLNKNFWEYYWYALCICTRAIWHEAEFGPATCSNNVTPDCEEVCAGIECGDPTYDCPEAQAPVRDMDGGDEVSWFGVANDSTLLDTQHNCDDYSGVACLATASCSSAVIPADCCTSGTDISVSGNGITAADEWDDGEAGLDPYCPAEAPYAESAFLRDVDAGLFDFIEDEAEDHEP